jgi:glycosyltransferase involved in cell wall biosynthesis
LFVEPFYGGSHRAFADGLARHSEHELRLLTLPEAAWRQRMRRGAQELAEMSVGVEGDFDFLVATDMLDLPVFLALTRPRFGATPVMVYFHENQFTYPRIRGTKLNSWFGQINYLSALAADVVAFNSAFHREDFLGALRALERQPNNWLRSEAAGAIAGKSRVLPVGLELAWLDEWRVPQDEVPLVLWNHRWEFDKSPEVFVRALERLVERGIDFRVAVAGAPGENAHPAMLGLPGVLGGRLVQFGHVEEAGGYARLLWRARVAVSTARQEFFGIAMAEAMYCECLPVAPKRLNYPALVPGELHEASLFETEEELAEKLARALTQPLPDVGVARAAAAGFGWGRVAQDWGAALEELAGEAGGAGRDKIRG